jgi:hypothetical protein
VPAQFSWDAISNMLQNVSGIQMDYETFKAEFDAIPQLANIVDRFDGQGIVLKTKEKPEATRGEPKDSGGVMGAAKRAASKTLGRPG